MVSDYFGREIKKGNIITYPVRKGSDMWIEHAKVLDTGTDQLQIQKSSGRTAYFKSPARAVIIGAKDVRKDFNDSIRSLA